MKKLWGAIYLVLVTTTCLGQSPSYQGVPLIETFDISAYDAGPMNRAIGQDRDGLLYFANGHGLLQFDGVEWKTFRINAGFTGISLLMANERIYVGSQGEFGYFQRDTNANMLYHSLVDQLDQGYIFSEVFDIVEANEHIYFCSYEYIFVFNPEIQKVEVIDWEATNPGVGILKGNLAISDYSGLSILSDQGITPLLADSRIGGQGLRKIIPTSKNHFLLFTRSSGVFTLEGTLLKPWGESAKALKNAQIRDVIRTKEGHFLIGTHNQGILKLDTQGRLIGTYDRNSGLKSNTINCLFLDQRNNLWVGHDNGISFMRYASPFSKIDDTKGVLGFGNAAALYQGELLLGSSSGLYRRVPDQDMFELVPGGEGNVLSIQQIGASLYIGNEWGVYVYESGSLTQISDWIGAWQIKPVPGYPDKLLIGGYKGLEVLNLKGQDRFEAHSLQKVKEPFRVMEFDKQGYLWMTHGLKGIFRLKIDFDQDTLEEVVFYDDLEIFPSQYFINVYKIDHDIVFTGDTGLYRFNHLTQRFEVSKKFSAFLNPSLHIRELEEDHLGNVYYWSGEEGGVIRNPGSRRQSSLTSPFFEVLSEVDNGIVNYHFVDESNLFLGANEGFIHVDPHKLIHSTDSFRLYIRQVDLFGSTDSTLYRVDTSQPLEQEITLDSKQNALRFSCSAIFYANREDVVYSYYIEDFDEAWSAWTPKSEKEYINLPPGSYRFMVKAQNIYQGYSNVASLTFRILPPWYQTKWAYVVYFLLLCLCIVLFYLRLTRKHDREKDILKQESQKEIHQKDHQIAEISKQKRDEIVRLRNEKLEAEISYQNQELASSTLHLLTKNQLLSDIKQELVNTQKSQDLSQLTKMIRSLVRKIDSSIGQDSEWEKFQLHFDRVHVDFLKRLGETHDNLSPQDLKIAAYLRMNLSSKEMAQMLNISLRGVEKARYRLRKKLELEANANLTQYIQQI